MKRYMSYTLPSLCICLIVGSGVDGRGFGGFRGGGGGYSGGISRSYSGGVGNGFSSFSGADRFGGSYSGSRSTSASAGWGGRSASSTYDHSWTNAAGGSISTSGSRNASEGRYGGVAASGNRDTTLTTASGKSYSADRQGGFASGPLGRTVGGASGTVDGRYGASNWNTAFAGNRYGGMAHYSSLSAATAHGTAYWSGSYMTAHAGSVRSSFGYYGCFHPAWYAAHPGCWSAAGWAADYAWRGMAWASAAAFCGLSSSGGSAEPYDYDYGSSVVYQGDNVYVSGQPAGTAQQYAQEATDIATKGQTATPPPTEEWKPLGVYALVEGDEKTSNNIFQLAMNAAGIIRGNYYDGLMDTTTEVYGSVDKKTQRAAWTIGKKKDRVFEAGVYNLTQPQCPCLIHIGTQKMNQMMLVRVEQPKSQERK